jgi:flagellar biosynthetic protein FliR
MSFELDITLIAVTMTLVIRFGIMAATLPLLDLRSVPPVWRIAMAFSFALALAPSVAATIPDGSISFNWRVLAMEGMRSIVLGMLLSFTINLIFTIVRYAGSIAGMQIGFAIVNSFDPMSNSQVSVISQLYYLMAVLIFFVTGSHHILISAMFESCLVVPPFGGLDAVGGAWYVVKEFSSVFIIGFRIAAPVVLVLFLVSASMGVIVKTVPQINVLVVGFPIKIAVGLITFGLSLIFFKQVTLSLMSGLEGKLAELLLALKFVGA